MPVNLFPDEPSMPQELVVQLFKEVQQGMAAHALPCLTQVYYPSKPDPELLENGTGTFVEVGGYKLLLSNEHVMMNAGLSHGFFGFDDFFQVKAEKYGLAEPEDLGAAMVANDVWSVHASKAWAVPLDRFADIHATVPHEILWTAGYPGARVKQFSDLVLSVCQALPTQEYWFHVEGEALHEKFDPDFHFAVAYSPDQAQPFDDAASSPGLSVPPGLSGSLVWNSRRLECHYRGEPWNPTKAVVTGIVWAWPKSNYLIATRVEHIRPFLLDVVSRLDHQAVAGAGSPRQL